MKKKKDGSLIEARFKAICAETDKRDERDTRGKMADA